MNQSFSSTASPVSYSWTRRIAIAVCLVVGVIYSIRALTRPAQATSSSTQDEQQPIETVQLGQRVVGRNPLREQTQLASDIRPETWRAVRLEMDAHGVKYDLAFLRSVDWIEAAGAQVGGMIDLRMPEMGLSGPALVKAIDPCPPIEPDDGEGRSVVTGTMSHPAANLLDIAIEGEPEPLGVTTTHPMWSEDQLRFVVAGDLKIGERLQRADGTLTQITRITPHTGPPVMVHNLEIDGEHVYCVGGAGLLVHNSCPTNLGPYSSFEPHQVNPGISQLEGYHVNGLGRVEPWRAHYDEFGRLRARTDYNAGNRTDGIPDVHHHTFQWGPGQNPEMIGNHIPGEFVP